MSVDLYQPQRSWLEVMVPAAELAKQIAGTDFVPKSIRNNPAAIAAAILFGDEVGFGPMQSLAKIAVIEGKPALAAEAQRALILRAGHALWIEDATTTKVTMCGRRKDSEEVTRVTWTMDDAKRANIAGRPSWRMYPRQMLTARATAELARVVFADAIGGLAAIEELEDPGEEVAALNGPAEESKGRRRRSKTALTSSTPDSTPAPAQPGPPLPGEILEESPPPPPTVASDEPGEPSPHIAEVADGAAEAEAPQEPLEAKPLNLEETKRKLDALVGQLREGRHITTEQLWSAMARQRNVEVEAMIALLFGRQPDGELHWSPLRDSLKLKEARELHGRLARLWVNVYGTLTEVPS